MLSWVHECLCGGTLEFRDQYSFDCQQIKSEQDWTKLLQAISDNAERFANYVESFSDEQLEAVFVNPKYGNYRRNREGVIEHSYYHLGQIALIKKLVTKV